MSRMIIRRPSRGNMNRRLIILSSQFSKRVSSLKDPRLVSAVVAIRGSEESIGVSGSRGLTNTFAALQGGPTDRLTGGRGVLTEGRTGVSLKLPSCEAACSACANMSWRGRVWSLYVRIRSEVKPSKRTPPASQLRVNTRELSFSILVPRYYSLYSTRTNFSFYLPFSDQGPKTPKQPIRQNVCHRRLNLP